MFGFLSKWRQHRRPVLTGENRRRDGAGEPDAANDQYRTAVNQILSVDSAHGVLSNDTDLINPLHPRLRASLLTSPSKGRLLYFGTDGSFVYAPSAGAQGNDSFQYLLSNGYGEVSVATVTIKVG